MQRDASSLIGPGEAARRLGVSSRTIQRWLRDGRLPAVRIGARLKTTLEAVDAMSAAARDEGSPGLRDRGLRRLLVANRGELVARIARTCRDLGVTSVALVADDQQGTWWSGQADERIALDGSYLDGEAVVAAARAANVAAIHPGYGFLAERAEFAEAVQAAGLIWVGPPAAAMRTLGDKASARRMAASLGIPVLEGYDGRGQSNALLIRETERIGYPVLLKPSAGGGGKGMHLVRVAGELPEALARSRREALAAFGDAHLVLERYLDRPRHIEVQLLCDAHGAAIHLGERDCSLQRRHQKVVEEAPAAGVTAALRARLGEAAIVLARAAGYVGVGTVEFLVDGSGGFYFVELNARLQVEHPVTEAVTGVDLVEAQLRVAAGERLWLRQRDVRVRGHALEVRLYAEDPWAAFLPAAGTVEKVAWPAAEGLRIDAGVGPRDRVGTRYDPLLAKLISHGPTRRAALDGARAGLDATRTIGVTTNRGFLMALLELPEVRRGDARTDTIETRWQPDTELIPERAWRLGAAAVRATLDPDGAQRVGFRLNGPPTLALRLGDEVREVALDPEAPPSTDWATRADGSIALDLDGRSFEVGLADPPTVEAALHHHAAQGAGDAIRAPMPGIVLAVRVVERQEVEAHEVLLVLEAMKMENTVTAPVEGTVARVLVRPGQAVQRGEVLVELG
ncbi:MAG: ATP-binding protein [Candidatus Limnocylindrales bacterium]